MKKFLSLMLTPLTTFITYKLIESKGTFSFFKDQSWNLNITIAIYSCMFTLLLYLIQYIFNKYYFLIKINIMANIHGAMDKTLNVSVDKSKNVKIIIDLINFRKMSSRGILGIEVLFPSWIIASPNDSNEVVKPKKDNDSSRFIIDLSKVNENEKKVTHIFTIRSNEIYDQTSREGKITAIPKFKKRYFYHKYINSDQKNNILKVRMEKSNV